MTARLSPLLSGILNRAEPGKAGKRRMYARKTRHWHVLATSACKDHRWS